MRDMESPGILQHLMVNAADKDISFWYLENQESSHVKVRSVVL